MTDERFIGQGDQGERIVTPGSEERAYVLRGSLPPETWRTLVKQLGFAFDISLEQIDHEADSAAQTGEHDLPKGEDDESKAEKEIIINRNDFATFAVEHGFTVLLASRAWNALTEFYDRKKRLLNLSKTSEIRHIKNIDEAMPIEFAWGSQRDRSLSTAYDGLKLESLVLLIERIEKIMGQSESRYALNRALDMVGLRNAGARSFDFYKALVDHYDGQNEEPESPTS